MFFINAEGLGEDFFFSSYPLFGEDAYNLQSDPNDISSSAAAEKFSKWVTKQVVPLINGANPQRKVRQNSTITANNSGKRNRDVHTDSPEQWRQRRIFVTLGMAGSEEIAGTLFPKYDSYRTVMTDSLTTDVLKTDFVMPPNKYAAVFDPDIELHAAPPIMRMLFKVRLTAKRPAKMDDAILPIYCPNSNLCIAPM